MGQEAAAEAVICRSTNAWVMSIRTAEVADMVLDLHCLGVSQQAAAAVVKTKAVGAVGSADRCTAVPLSVDR